MDERFPTPETVADWDDASLLATTGCESAIRYHTHGYEALNPTERVHCCFNLLESCINNGGVGSWIDSLCPNLAVATVLALQIIEADDMVAFVKDALQPMESPSSIDSKEAWVEHYIAMPDHVHERWETMTGRYLQLEDQFLKSAYAYARATWQHVRKA